MMTTRERTEIRRIRRRLGAGFEFAGALADLDGAGGSATKRAPHRASAIRTVARARNEARRKAADEPDPIANFIRDVEAERAWEAWAPTIPRDERSRR